MRRVSLLLLAASFGCAAVGCVPRKLFWSPDGKHGAVLGTQGLYLSDERGNLSELIAPRVASVVWFGDSKRFIAARSEALPDWHAAQALLSPQRRADLTSLLPRLREEIKAYTGDWKEFHSQIEKEVSPGEYAAMLLHVRDHDDGTLARRLGSDWEETKRAVIMATRLQVYDLADGGARAGKIIYSSLDGPLDLRVSPDGSSLAATFPAAADAGTGTARLMVLPIGREGHPTILADRASRFPDWSPDGEYIYYGSTRDRSYGIESSDGQKDQSFTLGTLSRRRVLDLNGGILSPPSEQEDLVGLLFWSHLKVRCLRDGRILFSSSEVKLPTTTAEMPQHPGLFSIDPAKQATVTRMLPSDADERVQGISMGQFELSPDEQRVVVIGSGTKEITVVTLATGRIDTIFPADRTPKELESMPAWRNSQEIVLLVPPGAEGGSPERSSVLIYSLDGKSRCISEGWPAIFAETPQASAPAQ